VRLGVPHPDYLLKFLTASQLEEWVLFDRLEPIGQERNDIMLGMVCANLTNIYNTYTAKKGTKPELVSPIDFISWLERDKEFFESLEIKSPEEVVAGIKAQFGLI